MNFPKPPEPPQPPPPPPSKYLFPHLYTVYYKKNNSTNLRFLKDFQSTIYEQFKKTFISKPSNNQQNNPKCKKINSETLLELASDKQALTKTKANKKTPLHVQSNQTEPHHVIRIPSLPSIETSSSSSINSIILERKGVSFSPNNSSNINVYRPLFTNSTFYLINIFLFIVCVITLLLFIVMISLMSRKYFKIRF